MVSRPTGANLTDLSDQTALSTIVSTQPWWCTPLFAAVPTSKAALVGDEVAAVPNINGVHGTGDANKEQQNIGTRADGNLRDKNQNLQPTSSTMAPVMPEIIAPQLKLGQPIACAAYPYNDPYFAGLVATYGTQSLASLSSDNWVQPQIIGMPHSRMLLPLEMAEEPVYVNAKQYHGILRRRQSRAKAELKKKGAKARKPYLHESRHLHAMKRARGCGGRFLNTKKAKKTDDDGGTKTDAPARMQSALSFNSLTSNGSGNTNSPSSIQGATPEYKMSPSTKGICQKKPESQFSYPLKPGEKGEDEDHRLRKPHAGIMMSQSPNWAITILEEDSCAGRNALRQNMVPSCL